MTGLEIAGIALVAIVAVGLGLACWAQRREIERLRQDDAEMVEAYRNAVDVSVDRWIALRAIAAATANIKHGTARKVHRMATEALAEQERIAANG